jgi:hypothetical protein
MHSRGFQSLRYEWSLGEAYSFLLLEHEFTERLEVADRIHIADLHCPKYRFVMSC